jgi:anti-anti-sigma factor
MDGELAITVRRERGVVIAAVTGDIDISAVTRLRERLSGLADGGQTLIVDLNRVTFIDSAGLGAAARRGPPCRRARRQPACGLRPAADPQAVVADRGGPLDSAGRHRGLGADVPGGVPGRSRLAGRWLAAPRRRSAAVE